jgi:2-dehydro-3-deoxyglucarate aldolase
MTRALKIQKVREKLKLGLSSIGSWMQIPNSSIAEIMGDADYDWICVDLEHGHFGYENLTDIFKSIELHLTRKNSWHFC